MATETLILATDTSTRHCSVALCKCSRLNECTLIAQTQADRHRLHAEGLLDSMNWVINASGYELESLDCLAVAIGPGSFTGLRVGAATWKGLAFALQKPLVAVPTLDAMSCLNHVHTGLVVPMLDARMNEVFGAVYRFTKSVRCKLTPDQVCSVDALLADVPATEEPVYAWGDGVERYHSRLLEILPHLRIVSPPCDTPRADSVACEAYRLLNEGANTHPAYVAPRYLRASQAEQARAAAAIKLNPATLTSG